MIEWQASRTRLPRSSLRPTPDLRDRLAVSRFETGEALFFAVGTFLTTALWFSDGPISARLIDATGTAGVWLFASVMMWLSKTIPFFHRNETARWFLVGAPAALAAATILVLSDVGPGRWW